MLPKVVPGDVLTCPLLIVRGGPQSTAKKQIVVDGYG